MHFLYGFPTIINPLDGRTKIREVRLKLKNLIIKLTLTLKILCMYLVYPFVFDRVYPYIFVICLLHIENQTIFFYLL